jgi:hypothetical protein
LQKTTDDLIIQLKTIGFPNDQFTSLSQALRMSDFVKFAKFVPEPGDSRQAFETIKSSIDSIEQTK